ncbi:S66 peptidase family protein [Zobellella sp. DQSA1]|uniref:S66 family peptidase n=1 Tax=Zobellella sp. DQSA1 TaxID=3342386 RepID=UPI0035C00431
MVTLLPKRLKPGDKIGFFSPSSPATTYAPNRFSRARSFLEGKGFQLEAGLLTGERDYYRSGTIQERAQELNGLIRNPDVRCIMSTIGGSNSNALLPYIDYDALRRDPKIIIGYSDVTAILLGIHAQTGLVTFYGPALVASLGELAPLVEETFDSFSGFLCKHQALPFEYSMPEHWTEERIDWENQFTPKPVIKNHWDFIGKGVVSGRLIGGNLNTMSGIWGSPYMPAIHDGDILLIEDSLKSIETVEKAFCHLKNCGIFDKVSAIILGKHELFDSKGSGRTPLDVLVEVLNGQSLPIFSGFDSCHTHPMLVTPIGVQAAIDFDRGKFNITGSWLHGSDCGLP